MDHPTFLTLRTEHRLSLSQLAARTGLRVALLSGFERGHALPDEDALQRLEAVYGPAVRAAVTSCLPPGLAELHRRSALSDGWLRTLCRLEFRTAGTDMQAWAELYRHLQTLPDYQDL